MCGYNVTWAMKHVMLRDRVMGAQSVVREKPKRRQWDETWKMNGSLVGQSGKGHDSGQRNSICEGRRLGGAPLGTCTLGHPALPHSKHTKKHPHFIYFFLCIKKVERTAIPFLLKLFRRHEKLIFLIVHLQEVLQMENT